MDRFADLSIGQLRLPRDQMELAPDFDPGSYCEYGLLPLKVFIQRAVYVLPLIVRCVLSIRFDVWDHHQAV